MIGRIKEVDGEKKIEWIAGRADGQGVPIGCIMAIYGNTAPNASWLICDGSTFDAETYSALALYLGGNRLPDLRECVLVGAGQSSNEYDASTNPNGIHEHDVYDVGEFKDDQFQGHWHGDGTTSTVNAGSQVKKGFINIANNEWTYKTNDFTKNTSSDGTNGTPRTGSTTHGKQVGVNYIIKATSVSAETDHAAILAQIQRWNSYSTEETLTGKTWIDGKPIYRRVFEAEENKNVSSNDTVSGWSTVITNISNVINTYMTASSSTEVVGNPFFARYKKSESKFYFSTTTGGNWDVSIGDIFILEYTKTMD